MDSKLNRLFLKMTEYFKGDKRRICHLTKVHSFASLIASLEGVDSDTKYIIEAAALVHDIGIKPSEEKYGSCTGKQQELEGPPVAEYMLRTLDFSENVIERVKYLVAHHHTYNNIDGIDYQILVEADFIVNMDEDEINIEAIKNCLEKIFKTKSGNQICKNMFM
ncbi:MULTISPECIES: HD domain-containing protein [unclassified Ruminococcus]|uniref:HD domain-containing protein n=1 Tax=unclassified Ruminococcus TaxID=2608920 RepID=UPI00210BEB3D|nr:MULTISPECIES: HD domain-containing protein [unclassified Ruminococcus]MCQ4022341.1 HD domain-containing protein [Ruminococcus sp. zg-924]MCQ4114669.1 HD domain-containing protein [Ruminococcus sp. zg-921]